MSGRLEKNFGLNLLFLSITTETRFLQPFKYFCDWIVTDGMTVKQCKELLQPEVCQSCGIDIPVEKYVLLSNLRYKRLDKKECCVCLIRSLAKYPKLRFTKLRQISKAYFWVPLNRLFKVKMKYGKSSAWWINEKPYQEYTINFVTMQAWDKIWILSRFQHMIQELYWTLLTEVQRDSKSARLFTEFICVLHTGRISNIPEKYMSPTVVWSVFFVVVVVVCLFF